MVLADVERTPDLLAELDDLNRGVGYVRCFFVEGQVLAEVDLVAETVDKEEIITAVERVLEIAQESGPALSAVYGGVNPQRTSSLVEAAYLDTVIRVDQGRCEPIVLTGEDATEQWPFGEQRVFVVTAWEPTGRRRPVDVNVDALAMLTADLVRLGAGILRAVGASPDRDHEEPSVLVWGIDFDEVITLGRRYGQDAIFAIDADNLTLIWCDTGVAVSRPRRTPMDEASP